MTGQSRLAQIEARNAALSAYIHSSLVYESPMRQQAEEDSVPIEYSEDSCLDDFPRLQSLLSNDDSFIQSFVSNP